MTGRIRYGATAMEPWRNGRKEVFRMEMTARVIREFKDKISKGPVLGPFCKTLDPSFIEILGYSGFDFCILDMEHGPAASSNLSDLIRACNVTGILPVVRVPEISEQAIGKALDLGAGAVQIPQITNALQAKKAIELARFYPKGERGVCRFVRAAHYSAMPREEYFESSNEILVTLQIEGVEAIHNLEEIMEVEGIDIIFIGPYDLSQSLGVPGQIDHLKVLEYMNAIVDMGMRRNIQIGTFVDTRKGMNKWIAQGVRYVSYSVDVGIFMDACKELVGDFEAAKN